MVLIHMIPQASLMTPKCQSTEPELNNEDLRAMVLEFMSIGSYDQSKSEYPIVVYLSFC